MASRNRIYRPRCYSLLWVVLVISALMIVKKHLFQETSMSLTDKHMGMLIGIGIVLFGLVSALRKRKSGRVVQNQ